MSNSRGSSALGLGGLGGGGGILGSLGGVVTALGLHMFALLVGGIFLLGGIGGWWEHNMKASYDSEMNPPATTASGGTFDGDLMQMINSKNAVLVGVAIERVLKENSKGELNVIDRSNPVMQVVINKLKQQGGGSIPDEADFDPMQCAYFIHTTFLMAGVDLPAQGTAHEYWTNRAPYESRGWNYIPNGTGMPSPGDLVVLAGPNPAGHIALVAGVDPPQGGKNGYVYMVQANAPNNYTKNAADHLTFMRWSINSSGLMQSGWSSFTIEGFIHNQALSQKWGDPFHTDAYTPTGDAKCDKNAKPLTNDQATALASQAGFTGHSLLVIVAIAHAESSLNPKACLRNTDAHHTLDRGIIQINNYWHSEVSDACAFDPKCSFEQGYRISSHGTSFTPWATYTSGAYRQFMPNHEA